MVGTPQVTNSDEDMHPLASTNCEQSDKCEENQFAALSPAPIALSAF